MRRLLAAGGAAALALWALAAFMLDGKTYTASPRNTVGVKLSSLEEGDRVHVQAEDTSTGKEPYNVMTLKKVE